jgi:unconventional prefoldin RPB5 interactor 1
MGIPNPDFGALEQRRLTLEDNILQLQQSLYHWRTWEAEYDGIREEIGALDNNASTEDFLAVGREFGGTLVDQEEMQKILGSQGVSRSRGQVVDLLGRRMDYVKQNVATMEKRLQTAENELHALDEQDQIPIEGGNDFPMREIMEELDEDDEVISSTINTPGDQAPELLDVLKQVGLQNIPEAEQSTENADPTAASVAADDKAEETPHIHSADCPVHAPEANDIVPEDDPDLQRPVSLVTPEDRQQPPVTDIDESPEEAKLRREMFQYGIDEVGAIVAELELDEEGSEFSFDEDDDYTFDSGEEENEDEYGRSHTVLSEEYHQQMRELEAKLNARGMYNVGKNTDSLPEEMRHDIENPPSVQDLQSNGVDSSEKGKKPKKRVAFAEDLDIAPAAEPKPVVAEKRTLPAKQADVAVLSDAIVERTDRTPDIRPSTNNGPKKVSRFKTARVAAPASNEMSSTAAESSLKPSQSSEPGFTRKQANAVPAATPPALFPATPQEPKPFSGPIADITETPSGPHPPEGKTLADKLVERDIVSGSAAAPELDELDEEMHRGQIATEFFKARNRKIQEQGGFMDEEQDTEYEIREGEIEPRRISKFRAARMK